jgi:hypothetical protein
MRGVLRGGWWLIGDGKRRSATMLTLCATLARCSLGTDPELEDFEFTAVEQPEAISEAVDARAFGGEIVFVGQLRTPHACFELRPDVEEGEGSVTLRIAAQPRNTTCPALPSAYRYTGVIRHVAAGTYRFNVVHAVAGQPERTHTFDLEVR